MPQVASHEGDLCDDLLTFSEDDVIKAIYGHRANLIYYQCCMCSHVCYSNMIDSHGKTCTGGQ